MMPREVNVHPVRHVNQDSESYEAQEMAKEIDLLDIGGVVDIDKSAL